MLVLPVFPVINKNVYSIKPSRGVGRYDQTAVKYQSDNEVKTRINMKGIRQ